MIGMQLWDNHVLIMYTRGPGACLVHHPRQSLSEKHPKTRMKRRYPLYPQLSEHYTTRRVSLPDFLPFPRIVRGICEFDTLFSYFHVFDTLNAIRALRAGWWKDTLFTRFYWRGWYRPQWDIPRNVYSKGGNQQWALVKLQ